LSVVLPSNVPISRTRRGLVNFPMAERQRFVRAQRGLERSIERPQDADIDRGNAGKGIDERDARCATEGPAAHDLIGIGIGPHHAHRDQPPGEQPPRPPGIRHHRGDVLENLGREPVHSLYLLARIVRMRDARIRRLPVTRPSRR